MRGIHQSSADSPHEGPVARSFDVFFHWANDWTDSGVAVDLRRMMVIWCHCNADLLQQTLLSHNYIVRSISAPWSRDKMADTNNFADDISKPIFLLVSFRYHCRYFLKDPNDDKSVLVQGMFRTNHNMNQWWLWSLTHMSRHHYVLTHPGQNGYHFADDLFRCIFVTEKFCNLIKISLKFVPKGQIDNIPVLV